MKNIFLVLGLVLSVTLGASELFAQSNGRKKRDSKKTPPTKIESKRSRKSADDSGRKKGRPEETHSRSHREQHGHRNGQDSRQRKSDAPSRSGERRQGNANSRGHHDHGRTGRDHGGQHRRGHVESNRRGDRRGGRPAAGHRGHQEAHKERTWIDLHRRTEVPSDGKGRVIPLVRCEEEIQIIHGSKGWRGLDQRLVSGGVATVLGKWIAVLKVNVVDEV